MCSDACGWRCCRHVAAIAVEAATGEVADPVVCAAAGTAADAAAGVAVATLTKAVASAVVRLPVPFQLELWLALQLTPRLTRG